MANRVIPKHSDEASKIPLASALGRYEIALNSSDRLLYFKDHNDVIQAVEAPSGDGSVGIQNTFEFVATASQSIFSGTDENLATLSYTPGNIYVVVDGFFISTSDYTASNGTSIVFTSALSAGQEVSIVAFEEFALAQPQIIPYGTILPIASNLAGSKQAPTSGVVDAEGWMYCDGSAIPASQVLSGNVPNLTDGRFLRGSTSAGSTGGSDSFTLSTTNMPAHTHTGPSHTHTGPSHTHSISHNHGAATTSSHAGHTHPRKNGLYANSDFYDASTAYGNNGAWAASTSGRSGGSHSHTFDVPSFSGTSGSGGTGNTGASGTGNTGSAGSGGSKEHIPKYVNVQFIIKVA